jgi:hypothetical protein
VSAGTSVTDRAYQRRRDSAILALTIGASAVAGGVLLTKMYGVDPLVTTLLHANRAQLVLAVVIGAVIQLVRAQRSAVLLSGDHRVRLDDAYHGMVVGHGIGDLVPIAPCGVALRCFLTERLSRLSLSFSAGVFMLEGVLDGLGPALLTGCLLLTLNLPTWLRILLVATLAQALFLFSVPFVAQILRRSSRLSLLPGWITRFIALGEDVADGLVSGLARGFGTILSVVGCSLLITALGAVQLVLFLSAFSLTTSLGGVLLILVLTLAAGSLPIKIPGSGTVATAAVLQVAGIHGAHVAGFVLMSRVVLSSETTLLACGTLAWWCATGKMHDLRVGAALQSLTQARWHAALSQARVAGDWLGGAISERVRVGGVRNRRRALGVAAGLALVVALLRPVADLGTGRNATFASAPLRSSASASMLRTTHRINMRDALGGYVREIPDSLRDALRAGSPMPSHDRVHADKDRA